VGKRGAKARSDAKVEVESDEIDNCSEVSLIKYLTGS
jgi:hypothetical protein